MVRYIVRRTSIHPYKVITVYDAQAQALEFRGEPLMYTGRRRAHAVAARLNKQYFKEEEEGKEGKGAGQC